MFIFIIISLLYISFYLHDSIITKSAAIQTAMRLEINKTVNISELNNKAVRYISNKTLFSKNIGISVYEDNGYKVDVKSKFINSSALNLPIGDIEYSAKINNNQPAKFIRIVNAIKDVFDKGDSVKEE